jgi:hypothetical protein
VSHVLQVRIEERRGSVTLQWVHVPGRRQFDLPLSSERIWTNSYKADHWVKLQKAVRTACVAAAAAAAAIKCTSDTVANEPAERCVQGRPLGQAAESGAFLVA